MKKGKKAPPPKESSSEEESSEEETVVAVPVTKGKKQPNGVARPGEADESSSEEDSDGMWICSCAFMQIAFLDPLKLWFAIGENSCKFKKSFSSTKNTFLTCHGMVLRTC